MKMQPDDLQYFGIPVLYIMIVFRRQIDLKKQYDNKVS